MDIELPLTPVSLPCHHHPHPIISNGILRVTCVECGERFSKALTPMEKLNVIKLYANGGHHPEGHVQSVFPTWSIEDRELFLLSNLCDCCWNEMMKEDDE